MRNLLLSLLFFIAIYSCTDSDPLSNDRSLLIKESENKLEKRKELKLAPIDYVSWIRNKENNLFQAKNFGRIEYSIQYKPKEYIACMELKKTEIIGKELESIKTDLGDLFYFDLTIGISGFSGEFLKYDTSSTSKYEYRVRYCSFEMKNDIKMVNGSDTISCSLFHFERTFNVVPYGKFMLAFENSKKLNKEVTIIFQDHLFDFGEIKFVFETVYFKNLPQLKTL